MQARSGVRTNGPVITMIHLLSIHPLKRRKRSRDSRKSLQNIVNGDRGSGFHQNHGSETSSQIDILLEDLFRIKVYQ